VARCYRTALDDVCDLLERALATGHPYVRVEFSEEQAEVLRLYVQWGDMAGPISRHRLRELLDSVEWRRERAREIQLLIPGHRLT
jgi:hypothetical protein